MITADDVSAQTSIEGTYNKYSAENMKKIELELLTIIEDCKATYRNELAKYAMTIRIWTMKVTQTTGR